MVCNHITVVAPVVVTIEVRNAQAGSGNYIKVYRNNILVNDSRYRSFYDFNSGDTAKFEAVFITGWTFQKFVSETGAVSTQNPFTVTVTANGIITAYFTENINTAGWTCIDNCQNMLQSGAEFRTQALCMADPCYIPPPPTCNTIAQDSWKPATVNPKSGASLPFALRSLSPNKEFTIGYNAGIPPFPITLVTGTTDSTGCYIGEIPAQPDGEYTIGACYPVLGVCINGFQNIKITWGAKPMSLQTMILIGLGLGAAYLFYTASKSTGEPRQAPLINIGR